MSGLHLVIGGGICCVSSFALSVTEGRGFKAFPATQLKRLCYAALSVHLAVLIRPIISLERE